MITLQEGVAIFAISSLVAIAARYFRVNIFKQMHGNNFTDTGPIQFLIKDGILMAQSAVAKSLLSIEHKNKKSISPAQLFEFRFPDIHAAINRVIDSQKSEKIKSLYSKDDAELLIQNANGDILIDLIDDSSNPVLNHRFLLDTSDDQIVKKAVSVAPLPIWITQPNGKVSYGNEIYEKSQHSFDQLNNHDEIGQKRIQIPSVTSPDIEKWFDLTTIAANNSNIHFAQDVTDIVRAEKAQKNFVQTLTKTFAQLSMGLAIFDKNRQLVLFNPAFTDLTKLSPDFLSNQPNLLAVFDKLRDHRIMPEPKNYAHWREKLAVLVAAAVKGNYSEVWNLPNGITYKVSGRPHPDGAIAFLFEDITAEIALTRRFRTELEMYYAVFDALDEAIAIFAAAGHLLYANAPYNNLWINDEIDEFDDISIVESSKMWCHNCQDSKICEELSEFVLQIDQRQKWHEQITHKQHGKMLCRIEPLPRGKTLVAFSQNKTIQ